MVLKREAEGTVTKATNCKIGLFSCPFDISATETKVFKTKIRFPLLVKDFEF
jgi:hypothetical protein